MRTLAAGNRKLLLRLNRSEWPTKLSLQTHALAPLPTTTVKEAVGGPEHGGGGVEHGLDRPDACSRRCPPSRNWNAALRSPGKRSGMVSVRSSRVGALALRGSARAHRRPRAGRSAAGTGRDHPRERSVSAAGNHAADRRLGAGDAT